MNTNQWTKTACLNAIILVYTPKTTWCHNQENHKLNTHCHEKQKTDTFRKNFIHNKILSIRPPWDQKGADYQIFQIIGQYPY